MAITIPTWAKIAVTSALVAAGGVVAFYSWIDNRFVFRADFVRLEATLQTLAGSQREFQEDQEGLEERVAKVEVIESQRSLAYELHLRVDSTFPGWQDTGVDVEVGDTLEFYATGEVVYLSRQGLEDQWASPRGLPTIKESIDYSRLVSQHPFMMLLGRVGSEPFPIGDSCSYEVNGTGRLRVAVNETDSREGRRDNRGALDLFVTRKRSARR